MRVVDIHIHMLPYHMVKPKPLEVLRQAAVDFHHLEAMSRDPRKLVAHLDGEGVERAGLINYVAPEVMGFTPDSNDLMAQYASDYPDRLWVYGGVHPPATPNVAEEFNRLLRLGVKAFKIHPPHQLFHANDYLRGMDGLRTLYRLAEAEGLPVTIHTGTSIFPGARNRYGNPLDVDDVAIDFPDLTIVMAHGGRPLWMEEAFFLLRRHPRVYLDLSGIPPKNLMSYFPRLGEISHKAMFGSDWPGPGVKSIAANVEAIKGLGLPSSALEAILHGTAEKVFSL
jgi:hypothetical protein